MLSITISYVVCSAIWYHLYNLKNVKNTNGRVNFSKLKLVHGCFSRFLNFANGTKSRNASHIFIYTQPEDSPFLLSFKNEVATEINVYKCNLYGYF